MTQGKSYEERMRELRVSYLTDIQADLTEMRTSISGAAAADLGDEARARLRKLAHDLRGSGGAYGFPEISETAGVLEDLIVAGDQPAALEPALTQLDQAAARAGEENSS